MGVGAERPKTWGGSSQKLGRIDRIWGGRGADRPGADRPVPGNSPGTCTCKSSSAGVSRNTAPRASRAPRRNTCLGFNWISRKCEETLNTFNGANLRRGETSSYPPFASASSAVRARQIIVSLHSLRVSSLASAERNGCSVAEGWELD